MPTYPQGLFRNQHRPHTDMMLGNNPIMVINMDSWDSFKAGSITLAQAMAGSYRVDSAGNNTFKGTLIHGYIKNASGKLINLLTGEEVETFTTDVTGKYELETAIDDLPVVFKIEFEKGTGIDISTNKTVNITMKIVTTKETAKTQGSKRVPLTPITTLLAENTEAVIETMKVSMTQAQRSDPPIEKITEIETKKTEEITNISEALGITTADIEVDFIAEKNFDIAKKVSQIDVAITTLTKTINTDSTLVATSTTIKEDNIMASMAKVLKTRGEENKAKSTPAEKVQIDLSKSTDVEKFVEKLEDDHSIDVDDTIVTNATKYTATVSKTIDILEIDTEVADSSTEFTNKLTTAVTKVEASAIIVEQATVTDTTQLSEAAQSAIATQGSTTALNFSESSSSFDTTLSTEVATVEEAEDGSVTVTVASKFTSMETVATSEVVTDHVASAPEVTSGVQKPGSVPDDGTFIVTNPGFTEFVVVWSDSASDGGSEILRYKIDYSEEALALFNAPQSISAPVINPNNSVNLTWVAPIDDFEQKLFTGYRIRYKSMVKTVPTISNITTSTEITSQIKLSWTINDGNTNVHYYKIEWGLNSGSYTNVYTTTGNLSSNNYSVPNLTNGLNYKFRVTAYNIVGASDPALITAIPQGAAVNSPTITDGYGLGNQSIRLKYTAPTNNGGFAITDYKVQYKTRYLGDNTEIGLGLTNGSYLKPNHFYKFVDASYTSGTLTPTLGSVNLTNYGSLQVTENASDLVLNANNSGSKFLHATLGDLGMDTADGDNKTPSWSISAWVKLSSNPTVLFGTQTATTASSSTADRTVVFTPVNTSWNSSNTTQQIRFGFTADSGTPGNTTTFDASSIWSSSILGSGYVHYLAVYDHGDTTGDGETRKIVYVNGVKMAEYTSGITTEHAKFKGEATDILTIGGRYGENDSQGVPISADDQSWKSLAIYNRALVQTDATFLYGKGSEYYYEDLIVVEGGGQEDASDTLFGTLAGAGGGGDETPVDPDAEQDKINWWTSGNGGTNNKHQHFLYNSTNGLYNTSFNGYPGSTTKTSGSNLHSVSGLNDHFQIQVWAWFVTASGVTEVEFETRSDDGSFLFVSEEYFEVPVADTNAERYGRGTNNSNNANGSNGATSITTAIGDKPIYQVVSNGGLQAPTSGNGTTGGAGMDPLEPGKAYFFRGFMWEHNGGQEFQVRWKAGSQGSLTYDFNNTPSGSVVFYTGKPLAGGGGGSGEVTSIVNNSLTDAFIAKSYNDDGTGPWEVRVTFPASSIPAITSYKFWAKTDTGNVETPQKWELRGISNGTTYDRNVSSTYTVIDSRSNQVTWPVTAETSLIGSNLSTNFFKEYFITSPSNYKQYVFYITKTNDTSNPKHITIGQMVLSSENTDRSTATTWEDFVSSASADLFRTITGLDDNLLYKFKVGSINNNNVAPGGLGPYSSETSWLSPESEIASGGTKTQVTENNQKYFVHKFTSSANLTFNTTTKVRLLMVAGGGGGGIDMGGGGGAGGLILGQDTEIKPGTYPIVIGAGGSGAPAAGSNGQGTSHSNFTVNGTNGNDTVLDVYVAKGGGYGGTSKWSHPTKGLPNSGGSGGGASAYDQNIEKIGGVSTQNAYSGISTVTGYGNAGGDGYSGNNQYGGGGGGAGQAGTSASNNYTFPHGGDGKQDDILGTNYWWCGGGGGAGHSQDAGNGGKGGGGGGSKNSSGKGLGDAGNAYNDGTDGGETNTSPGGDAGANTGGGGGGGPFNTGSSAPKGGDGGSGILVIKYKSNPLPPSNLVLTVTGLESGFSTSWTVNTNGSAITAYELKYKKNDVNTWTTVSPSISATSHSITGLENDVVYNVQLTATNSEGSGSSNVINITPKKTIVTGGEISAYSANNKYYKVHKFTDSTDSLKVLYSGASVDYFMVGGGGGGGTSAPSTVTYQEEAGGTAGSTNGTPSSSSTLSGSAVSRAFDGNLDDINAGWCSNANFGGNGVANLSGGVYVGFEFDTNKTITKYKIWGRSSTDTSYYTPKSWELRGVTEGTTYVWDNSDTYTVVDKRDDEPDFGPSYPNSITNDTNRVEYYVSSPRSYKKYILNVTKSHNNNFLFIGQIIYYSGTGGATHAAGGGGGGGGVVYNLGETINVGTHIPIIGSGGIGGIGNEVKSQKGYNGGDTTFNNKTAKGGGGGGRGMSATEDALSYNIKPSQGGSGGGYGGVIETAGYTVEAGAGGLKGIDVGTATEHGIATASHVHGTFLAEEAFNETHEEWADAWHTPSNILPVWLSFEFPTNKTITRYKIWGGSTYTDANPTHWTIRGVASGVTYDPSNSSTYTEIDTRSGISGSSNWPTLPLPGTNDIQNGNNAAVFDIPSENQGSYKTYVIHITAVDGHGYNQAHIAQLAYYSTKTVPIQEGGSATQGNTYWNGSSLVAGGYLGGGNRSGNTDKIGGGGGGAGGAGDGGTWNGSLSLSKAGDGGDGVFNEWLGNDLGQNAGNITTGVRNYGGGGGGGSCPLTQSYVLEAGAGGLNGDNSRATAYGIYNGSYDAPKAFDGNISNNADSWVGSADSSGPFGNNDRSNQELRFLFPTAKTITKYIIWPRMAHGVNETPTAWQLRGVSSGTTYNPSDSSTYTIISQESNETWTGFVTSSTPNTNDITNKTNCNEYLVDNPGSYIQYILHVTDVLLSNSYPAIGQMAYYSGGTSTSVADSGQCGGGTLTNTTAIQASGGRGLGITGLLPTGTSTGRASTESDLTKACGMVNRGGGGGGGGENSSGWVRGGHGSSGIVLVRQEMTEGAPYPPGSGLEAIPAGTEKIRLFYDAPLWSGGVNSAGTAYVISDYIVQQSSNSGNTWTVASISSGSGADLTRTIQGLTNGTKYTFRIKSKSSSDGGTTEIAGEAWSSTFEGTPTADDFSIEGGTVSYYTDSSQLYKIHSFLYDSSNNTNGQTTHSIKISGYNPNLDMLVVGGGGSGGSKAGMGGGGGGGMVLSGTSVNDLTGSYNILVGGGGLGSSAPPTSGKDSSVGKSGQMPKYVALGGGTGAGKRLATGVGIKGSDGGSGGGESTNGYYTKGQSKAVLNDNSGFKLEAGAGGLDGSGSANGAATHSSADGTKTSAKAFNGTLTDANDCWLTTDVNSAEKWIAFEFPSAVTITMYKLWLAKVDPYVADSFHPTAWELRGATDSSTYSSSNSTTWKVVDFRFNQQGSANWATSSSLSNPVVNDIGRNQYICNGEIGTYKYYVLQIKRTSRKFLGTSGSPQVLDSAESDKASLGQIAYYSGSENVFDLDSAITTKYYKNNAATSNVEVYGNDGGNGATNLAGGGGGAGQIGQNASGTTGGAGGNGKQIRILYGSTTSTGHLPTAAPASSTRDYYGGGGGGSSSSTLSYVLEAGGSILENSNTLRGGGGVNHSTQGTATTEGETSIGSWTGGPTSVFNGTLDNDTDGVHTDSGIFSGGNSGNNIFHIMFEFPTSTTITKYKIWGRGAASFYSPKSWQLRGATSSSAYNNGSGTYDVLDIQTDVADIGQSTSTSITNDTDRGEYFVSSPGSYTTYVLDIGSSYDNNHCFIGEIAYYSSFPTPLYVLEAGGSGTENPSTLRPVHTQDDNAAGSTYSSEQLSTDFDVEDVFNGSTNNSTDAFHSKNHNPVEPNDPAWIAIKFPGTTTKKITKYKLWTRNEQTYKWQPVDWEIRGVATGVTYNGNSTSSSDYTILDTVTGETNWEQSNSNSVANNTECKEFEITTPGYYNTYVINITNSRKNNSDSTGTHTSIGQWALYSVTEGGTGGDGGGGNGGNQNVTSGTNNTGGGGGGTGVSGGQGGDGGSGIVVFKYPITAPTVPSPPTDLKTTATGDATVDLEWTAPSDSGGSAVTDYKIEYIRPPDTWAEKAGGNSLNGTDSGTATSQGIAGGGGQTGASDTSFNSVDGVVSSVTTGDKGQRLMYTGQQHPNANSGQTASIETIDLANFGTNTTSLIGCDVYIYLRYIPGTSSQGDIQFTQIDANGASYGITEFNTSTNDFHYTKWQTTRRTNNADYRHGNTNTGTRSGWSTDWHDVETDNHTDNTDAGRWNNDSSNQTQSNSTGVNVGDNGAFFYEQSSEGRSDYGVTSVFLRSPKITLTSDTVKIYTYAYGSQIGTIYCGVYVDSKPADTLSSAKLAFNNSLTDYFSGKSYKTDGTGPWELRFEFPSATVVDSYRMWAGIGKQQSAPNSWELRGVSDGDSYDRDASSTYTVLDTQTEQNMWESTSSSSLTAPFSEYKEYKLSDTAANTSYTDYILHITKSNSGGTNVDLGQVIYYDFGASSGTWTEFDQTGAASTSVTKQVTGLTNGDSYQFKVSAINSVGTSSPTSDYITGTPMDFLATGGDTVTTYSSGGVNYKVHVFTSSGTFTLSVTGTTNVDFLIVAGGGAGGFSLGGGGGGGGVISGTNYTLTQNADLTITVGTGATGPTSSNNVNDGNDSEIQGTGFNFKAHGGGGGGGYGHYSGNSGGSGGGHGWHVARNPMPAKYYDTNGTLQDMPSNGQYTMSTSSGTVVVYGNKGGQHGGSYVPSAGGGAGQVGGGTSQNNKQYQAHGGDGIQIAWTTPQALGVTGGNHGIADTVGFYWGGGGGANNHGNISGDYSGSGDGGKGGGGAGKRRFNTNSAYGIQGVARSGGYAQPSLSNVPSNGSGGDGGTNTGGGGGGGDYNTSPYSGGAGGSGIVVIRYVV